MNNVNKVNKMFQITRCIGGLPANLCNRHPFVRLGAWVCLCPPFAFDSVDFYL